jgi:hypothetical protein
MTVPGSLGVRYLVIRPPKQARYVVLDFSRAGKSVDADALVYLAGALEGEHRHLDDGRLTYCRDDQKDDIEFMYVALSNHALRAEGDRSSTFTYRTAASCPLGVTGSLTLSVDGAFTCDQPAPDGGVYTEHLKGSAEIDERYDAKEKPPEQHGSALSLSGTWSYTSCGPEGDNGSGSASGTVNGFEPDTQRGVQAFFRAATATGNDVELFMEFYAQGSQQGGDTCTGDVEVEYGVHLDLAAPAKGSKTVSIDEDLSPGQGRSSDYYTTAAGGMCTGISSTVHISGSLTVRAAKQQ